MQQGSRHPEMDRAIQTATGTLRIIAWKRYWQRSSWGRAFFVKLLWTYQVQCCRYACCLCEPKET